MVKKLKQKTEVKDRPKITKTFYVNCPICKNEITGTSKKQAITNLRIHIQTKHPERDWEKEIIW